MPVVKGTHALRLTGDAIVLDLGDLQRQAQRLRESAQREADALLAAAREEADALIRGADARGYADGLARGTDDGTAKGREEGRAQSLTARGEEIDALLGRWKAALQRWEDDRLAMRDAAREELLALAMRIARRIVLRVADLDPAVAAAQAEAAIDLAGQSHIVSIRVHPDDLAAVSEVMPGLLDQAGKAPGSELVSDEQVGRGGVIVRTRAGEIDARLETQIERMVDELLPGKPR